MCRNRGPCWSARPPSLRCDLRFGLLFSRFSVPPSLRGLSPHHPISCRRVLPAPKGLRLPCSYLLGLPPSGSSFQRAVAAPLAFPVRREDNIYVCEFYVNKNFIYVYVESKNTADTTKARRSRPAGHKKPLTGRGEEVPKDLWENLLNIF